MIFGPGNGNGHDEVSSATLKGRPWYVRLGGRGVRSSASETFARDTAGMLRAQNGILYTINVRGVRIIVDLFVDGRDTYIYICHLGSWY